MVSTKPVLHRSAALSGATLLCFLDGFASPLSAAPTDPAPIVVAPGTPGPPPAWIETDAGEAIDWTAPSTASAGPASFVVAFDPGSVSYRARITVSIDRTMPRISAVRPHRDGVGVALSLRLSEPALVTGCIEPVGRAGPGSSGLYRRLPGIRLDDGANAISLGSMPRGRYRVRLLVRDRAGNSKELVRGFGRLPHR